MSKSRKTATRTKSPNVEQQSSRAKKREMNYEIVLWLYLFLGFPRRFAYPYFKKRILEKSSEVYVLLDKAKLVSSAEPQFLKKLLRKHTLRESLQSLQSEIIAYIFSIFTLISMLYIFIELARNFFSPKPPYGSGGAPFIFIIYLFIYMLYITKRIDRAFTPLTLTVELIFFPTLFSIILFIFNDIFHPLGDEPGFHDLIRAIGIFMPLVGIVFVFLFLLSQGMRYIQERLYRAKYPLSVIVVNLLYAATELKLRSTKTTSLKDRQRLMWRLEKVAVAIQVDLPKQLRSGDLSTDSWTEEAFHRIATDIRNKKRYILIPSDESWDALSIELFSAFNHWLIGDWREIEGADIPEVTRATRTSVIVRAMRTVIVGILPGIMLVIFRGMYPQLLPIGSFVSDILTIGIILWLVVSIADLIDPTFKERLSAFNNIRGALSPFK